MSDAEMSSYMFDSSDLMPQLLNIKSELINLGSLDSNEEPTEDGTEKKKEIKEKSLSMGNAFHREMLKEASWYRDAVKKVRDPDGLKTATDIERSNATFVLDNYSSLKPLACYFIGMKYSKGYLRLSFAISREAKDGSLFPYDEFNQEQKWVLDKNAAFDINFIGYQGFARQKNIGASLFETDLPRGHRFGVTKSPWARHGLLTFPLWEEDGNGSRNLENDRGYGLLLAEVRASILEIMPTY